MTSWSLKVLYLLFSSQTNGMCNGHTVKSINRRFGNVCFRSVVATRLLHVFLFNRKIVLKDSNWFEWIAPERHLMKIDHSSNYHKAWKTQRNESFSGGSLTQTIYCSHHRLMVNSDHAIESYNSTFEWKKHAINSIRICLTVPWCLMPIERSKLLYSMPLPLPCCMHQNTLCQCLWRHSQGELVFIGDTETKQLLFNIPNDSNQQCRSSGQSTKTMCKWNDSSYLRQQKSCKILWVDGTIEWNQKYHVNGWDVSDLF